jgi:hypothetical protein
VKKVNKNKDISRVPVLIFCFLALSVGFIIFAISPFAKDNLSSKSNQQINTIISETPTPTPVPNKTGETIVSPTPMCSPTPTPQSEANNPDQEPTLSYDGMLGSPDVDCDGVRNAVDNCVLAYNPRQKDKNKDGYGDACDPKTIDKSFTDLRCDIDGDGIPDGKDNCPAVCNPRQTFLDINENGVNDLCDSVLPDSVSRQSCAKRIKVKPPKLLRIKDSDNK